MNGVVGTIINSLANNERVELRGLVLLELNIMPKKARNPGTGEPVYLPERYVPFKPSKLMRSKKLTVYQINKRIHMPSGKKRKRNEHAQKEKETSCKSTQEKR